MTLQLSSGSPGVFESQQRAWLCFAGSPPGHWLLFLGKHPHDADAVSWQLVLNLSVRHCQRIAIPCYYLPQSGRPSGSPRRADTQVGPKILRKIRGFLAARPRQASKTPGSAHFFLDVLVCGLLATGRDDKLDLFLRVPWAIVRP
jgi:hypothetical protein